MNLLWKQMHEMQMAPLQVSLLPQNFVYSVYVCKLPFLSSEKCEIIKMDVAVMHATTPV